MTIGTLGHWAVISICGAALSFGCLGDFFFRVKGRIVEPDGTVLMKQCKLALYVEGESEATNSAVVEGEFIQTLGMPRRDITGHVTIECQNHGMYQSAVFRIYKRKSHDEPVDLGTISTGQFAQSGEELRHDESDQGE